jgi:hypothetical protein
MWRVLGFGGDRDTIHGGPSKLGICTIPRDLGQLNLRSVPDTVVLWQPNAAAQPRLKAEAQRTL